MLHGNSDKKIKITTTEEKTVFTTVLDEKKRWFCFSPEETTDKQTGSEYSSPAKETVSRGTKLP